MATSASNLVDSSSIPEPPTMKIAVLTCPGSDVETYDIAFKRWIDAVPKKEKLEWQVYFCDRHQFPPSTSSFHAYIISGSKHGVYEDIPWIQELCEWIRDAHQQRKKLLGICFGHQAVAKALGGEVQVNPAGFVIGRYPTSVSEGAREYFQRLGTWGDLHQHQGLGEGQTPEHLTMNFVHGDYVVQAGVPEGLQSMGGTHLSPHNGLFNGDNILTFQGHPEFTSRNVGVCLEKLTERGVLPARFPSGIDADKVQQAMDGKVDSGWIGQTALRFFQDSQPQGS